MKKTIALIVGVFLLNTSLVFAAPEDGGSDIEGNVTNNLIIKQKSKNLVRGDGSTGNLGAITIKKSQIKGEITNSVKLDNGKNYVKGTNNTGNLATITVRDSKVKGKVTNTVDLNSPENNADFGNNLTANYGSITIE